MRALSSTAWLRTALRASRPLAHANVAPSLLLGQALAYPTAGFSLAGLVYAQLFGVLDHLFIVFSNDYADRHSDTGARTLVSGGSGVLVDGSVRPATMRRLAIAAGVALAVLGFARGPVTFGLALSAIALMLAYSYPPLRLSHRGHGEWLQGVGVGLVLPSVGFHAQAGSLDLPLEALIGPVLLATASNAVTAMPDLEDDARAGKRTLPVRLGAVRAGWGTAGLTLVGGALTLALSPIDHSARAAIVVVAMPPLALAASTGPGGDAPARVRWALGMAASQALVIVGVTVALFVA